MSDVNKIVSSDTKLVATLEVRRVGKVTVNPNGRGYSSDDVERATDVELMSVTVQARDRDSLAKKVEIIMLTLDEEE